MSTDGRENDSGSAAVPNDPLDRPVSIVAKFDTNGLEIKTRSRFVAAADWLLGGLVGVGAEWFERHRQRMHHDNMMSLRVMSEVAAATQESPDFGRFISKLAADELHKLENKFAVVSKAKIALIEGDRQSPVADTSDPIDPDWLNVFAAHAERATSDRIRDLWGAILAGQIRAPGSFSLLTLRIISELDQDIAKVFQARAGYRCSTEANDGGDVYILWPDHGGAQLEREFQFLQDVGLLESGGRKTVRFMSSDTGETLPTVSQPLTVFVWCGLHALLADSPADFVTTFVPVATLTRAGRQLVSILPRDGLQPLQEIASQIKMLRGQLRIGRLAETERGHASFVDLEPVAGRTR